MKKRVVITGLGAITPIGTGKDEFWNALLGGKSGITRITRFDPSEYATQIAGEIKDFEPGKFMDKKEAKRMDRFTQLAVAATKLAFEDSGMDLEAEDKNRIGTLIGTGIGGMDSLHDQYKVLFDKGPNRISPFFVPMMIANMAAGQTSITFGLQGPCSCVVTACATGTNAIGDAYQFPFYRSQSHFIFFQQNSRIVPAKAKGIGKCCINRFLTRHIRYVVKIKLRIRSFIVYRRMNFTSINCQGSSNTFDSASCSQ